jgi:hypothetical protein
MKEQIERAGCLPFQRDRGRHNQHALEQELPYGHKDDAAVGGAESVQKISEQAELRKTRMLASSTPRREQQ